MSPWERRERGGLCYTRSRKVDGRVVRQYVGGGVLGELAARTDELKRLEREEQAAADREERERLETLDAPLAEAWEATEVLVRAALVASGYRQHKRGEWRKRRGPKDAQG